eukprot:1892-Chlamydomonas_euryale.AAC.1
MQTNKQLGCSTSSSTLNPSGVEKHVNPAPQLHPPAQLLPLPHLSPHVPPASLPLLSTPIPPATPPPSHTTCQLPCRVTQQSPNTNPMTVASRPCHPTSRPPLFSPHAPSISQYACPAHAARVSS